MNSGLKRILKPSLAGVLLLVALSAAFLVTIHYNLIEQRLVGRVSDISLVETQDLRETFEMYLALISQSRALYYIVLGLFWGGLGLVAYAVLWVVGNLLVELRNWVVYEKYYINKSGAFDRLLPWLGQLAMAVAVIAAVTLTISYGLPLWLAVFSHFVLQPISVLSLIYGLGAIAGLAFNLYVVTTTYRIFLKTH